MISRRLCIRKGGDDSCVAPRLLALTAALATTALTSSLSAYAAAARVPASYYPAGAHIAYFPTVSNHKLDCSWGFYCEGGVPLFHFQTQDQLHRLSGWAEYAGWRHLHHTMGFALYASRYQPGLDRAPWSRAAFDDLLVATRAQGYIHLRQFTRLLPAGSKGDGISEIQRAGPKDIVVMACWIGSIEVEGIVVFDHRSATAYQLATRYLSEQVQTAVRAS